MNDLSKNFTSRSHDCLRPWEHFLYKSLWGFFGHCFERSRRLFCRYLLLVLLLFLKRMIFQIFFKAFFHWRSHICLGVHFNISFLSLKLLDDLFSHFHFGLNSGYGISFFFFFLRTFILNSFHFLDKSLIFFVHHIELPIEIKVKFLVASHHLCKISFHSDSFLFLQIFLNQHS